MRITRRGFFGVLAASVVGLFVSLPAKTTWEAYVNKAFIDAYREALRAIEPVVVLDKLGHPRSMPRNKGSTVKVRRPTIFTVAGS